MKKKNILFMIFVIGNLANSQNNSKHENWYKCFKIDSDNVFIEIVEARAQLEFCKLKIKITNKSNDILIYEPIETEFDYGINKYHPEKVTSFFNSNHEFIWPTQSITKVLTVKGNNKFHVDNFRVNLRGLYKITGDNLLFKTSNYKLPISTNNFETGPFKVSLNSISKKTKKTTISFKVIYSSEQETKAIGLINSGNAVLKLEDGSEFAISKPNDKKKYLLNGEDTEIKYEFEIPSKITDMQFANMELVWRDTFTEKKKLELIVKPLNLIIDMGMTEGKNR